MKYQVLAKEKTLKNILKECIKRDRFTSIDIVDSLKLTKPTVNESLDILFKNDFITKENFTEGMVGRKAQIWKTTLHKKQSLAIDIDFNLVKIAVIDMSGNYHNYKEYKKTINNNNFFDVISFVVNDYRNKYKEYLNIKQLGISIPGNISFDRKNILYATNLGLNNINIKNLEYELNLNIILENEANSAVLGEFYLSKETDKNNYMLISISNFGVGGGQIVDGKLLKGAHRLAGEIGHFTIIMDGEPCTCGNRGCFERYASYDGLKNIMKKNKLDFDDINQLFESYDKKSEKVIKEYCKFLGRGIRSLLSIYDSSKIILSGKMIDYWDRIYPYIQKEIFENNNFYSKFNVMVFKSKLGDKSSLVGVGLINFFEFIYDKDFFS
ncbi:ROK family protein [Brachyspira sp.]|uniref:ROK family protein n=1 Tax=Brachyspira sp. TaxID=1977261 RepID=UPI00262E0F68|nr:ROK family protein [Brachyspira sp.]